MKKLSTLLIVLSILVSSCSKDQTITNKADYQAYLETTTNKSLEMSEKAISFWSSRITQDSIQIIELGKSAGGYTGVFQTTADINALKKAEQNLKKAVQKAAIGKDGYLRALAQNYITQHRFKEAATAIQQAEEFGGEKRETNFLKFDVAIELGHYDAANKVLEKETDFSNFNYLIRRAKWEDYKGNLSSTIDYMEKAKATAERGKQEALMLWVYTNLADYYGHDGRIKESYAYYLKALKVNPNNAYAKKGIAWIAYANDNNPYEALRIIEIIEKETNSPDYNLLKAEIHSYLGDINKSEKLTQEFIAQAKNPLYGEMYNSYLLEIYANNATTLQDALAIAKRELDNRATPETYDLLSYAYLKNGNAQKALEIQKQYVLGKTYEPVAQLHITEIYKELGMNDKIEPLKKELLEASFELGTAVTRYVKNI